MFINNDKNLLLLDFLVVADTRLSEKNKTCDLERSLSNWKLMKRFDSNDGVIHMGLIILQSCTSKEDNIAREIREKKYVKNENGRTINYTQVMTVSFLKYNIKCAFVYIRQTPTDGETRKLEKFLKSFDLVMGDLNLDTYREGDLQKIKILCEKKTKVLNEITTVRFNQLDHVLLDCSLFPNFFTTSFRNHTTDHYAPVIRIPVFGNNLTEAFLRDINFDQEHWSRASKRKGSHYGTNDENPEEKTKKTKENKTSTLKRNTTKETKNVEIKRTKLFQMSQSIHRTFENPDFESCWINSCLQMILTSLDHSSSVEENGSPLWNQLILLKKKGKSSSLDPLPIRDIIINNEKERILRQNIAPLNRLFDLGSVEVFQETSILMDPSTIRRLGQQDCKDFFICLSENREHWYDVYSLFMVESVSSTTCSYCNHVSSQNHSLSLNPFFIFECPTENISMSSFLEKKLNSFELVPNWRDEDGCQRKVTGQNSIRITDMSRTQHLIFIIGRLIKVDGNLEIVRKKVPSGGDILLDDVQGNTGRFTPIAVIHHSGDVINNTTRGHYQADVLDKESGHWVRTSDDEPPSIISKEEITEEGYIYLYKKIQ